MAPFSFCRSVLVGMETPQVCPVCVHPQSCFEISAESY